MAADGLHILIPGLQGPVGIVSLKARPGLPLSQALAAKDHAPQPWSADYDAFLAPGGPVRAVLPDLRPDSAMLHVSEVIDAGRLWEAPVALAHWAAGEGRTLAPSVAKAGALLWIAGTPRHGEVETFAGLPLTSEGLDLAALIEASAKPLAEAAERGTRILAILGAGPDAAAAAERLNALLTQGRSRVTIAATMGEAIAVIDGPPAPALVPGSALAILETPRLPALSAATGALPPALYAPRRPFWRRWLGVGVGAAASLAVLSASAAWWTSSNRTSPAQPVAALTPKATEAPRTSATSVAGQGGQIGAAPAVAEPATTGALPRTEPPARASAEAAPVQPVPERISAPDLPPAVPPFKLGPAPLAPPDLPPAPAFRLDPPQRAAASANGLPANPPLPPIPQRPLQREAQAPAQPMQVAALPEPPIRPSAQPQAQAAALRVTELRAPPGAACISVYLGEIAPQRRALPITSDGSVAPSRGPEICGLEFTPSGNGALLMIGDDLARYGVTQGQGGAARILFGEGRRNRPAGEVNYVIEVRAPGAGVRRYSHAVTPR